MKNKKSQLQLQQSLNTKAKEISDHLLTQRTGAILFENNFKDAESFKKIKAILKKLENYKCPN